GHFRRISIYFGRSRRQRRRVPGAKPEDILRCRTQNARARHVDYQLSFAPQRPELGTLIPTFLPNVPQVFVKVDRDKVIKQGIDLGQVYQTLQTFMGGFFVNYFNRFGRTWQVYIEAEGDYRTDAKNVGEFFVRNANGDPVPLD